MSTLQIVLTAIGVIIAVITDSLDSAFLFFGEEAKNTLLQLKPGQRLRVKGTISKFSLMPHIRNCQVVWAEPPRVS
jgi:hypothetical protein